MYANLLKCPLPPPVAVRPLAIAVVFMNLLISSRVMVFQASVKDGFTNTTFEQVPYGCIIWGILYQGYLYGGSMSLCHFVVKDFFYEFAMWSFTILYKQEIFSSSTPPGHHMCSYNFFDVTMYVYTWRWNNNEVDSPVPGNCSPHHDRSTIK